MAWITPPVFTALQTLTAAVMNQVSSRLADLWVGTTAADMDYYSASDTKTRIAIGNTDDVMTVVGGVPAWAANGFNGASLFLSNPHTVLHDTNTVLTFDAKLYDTMSMYSAGAPERLTCTKTGYYLVGITSVFAYHATGYRMNNLLINGDPYHIAFRAQPVASGISTYLDPTPAIVSLTATQYLQVRIYQNSTASINVEGGRLWAIFLGA